MVRHTTWTATADRADRHRVWGRANLDAGAAVLRERPGRPHGRPVVPAPFRASAAQDAFSPGMTYALEDFRKVMSYANNDATILWDKAMDRVLKGEAAIPSWAIGVRATPTRSGPEDRRYTPTRRLHADARHGRDVRVHDRHVRAADRRRSPRRGAEAAGRLRICGRAEDLQSAQGIDLRPPGRRDPRRTIGGRHTTTSSTPATTQDSRRRPFSPRGPTSTRSAPRSAPSRRRGERRHQRGPARADNYADLIRTSCWPDCVVSARLCSRRPPRPLSVVRWSTVPPPASAGARRSSDPAFCSGHAACVRAPIGRWPPRR